MKFTEKDIRFLMNKNYLLSEIREIEKHDFEFESVLNVSGRRLPLTENVALKYLGREVFLEAIARSYFHNLVVRRSCEPGIKYVRVINPDL